MDLLTPRRSPNSALPLHTQKQCTARRSSWQSSNPVSDHERLLETPLGEGHQASRQLSDASSNPYGHRKGDDHRANATDCCHPTSGVASCQRLRSSSRHHLVVPRHRRSTIGRRAFSVAGPMAWNSLPNNLRDPSLSADNFWKELKMHPFRNALGHSAH